MSTPRKKNDPGPDQRQDRVKIRQLPTGVPGLDEILGGGGLPEYSFNLIAGAPGCGKTTLAHQIMFANASPSGPALYFTVLGEPAIKMLRYQQQFAFFDQPRWTAKRRSVSSTSARTSWNRTWARCSTRSSRRSRRPTRASSWSTRSAPWCARPSPRPRNTSEMELQGFVQRLALHLTSWQATTFLIGEYVEGELRDNPVFTVADGILWLYQSVERNSIVRKLQVMKMRGQASVPGLHTFRITDAGVQVFPRTFGLSRRSGPRQGPAAAVHRRRRAGRDAGRRHPRRRAACSWPGPPGRARRRSATQFIAEGLRQGEPGVVAVFEELPAEYVQRAAMFGIDFDTPQNDGKLKLIYLRPLDLSVDETLHEISSRVKEIGAKRLVIDSLAGFELALAPGFREDFRESLYRMIGALTRLGVTIFSTVEVEEDFTRWT